MKKSGLIFIIFVWSLLLFACSGSQPGNGLIFDATQIKGHPDTTEVKKLLHAVPDSSYYRLFFGQPRFIQLYYAMDSSEFRYKDGKLIEIIVNKPSMPYKPESIARFGLPSNPPTSQDSMAYIMWKNVFPEYEAVNFYLVGSKENSGKKKYKVYFKLKP